MTVKVAAKIWHVQWTPSTIQDEDRLNYTTDIYVKPDTYFKKVFTALILFTVHYTDTVCVIVYSHKSKSSYRHTAA